MHVPLSGPVYPPLQVQTEAAVLEAEDAGQTMQVVAPVTGLYFPPVQVRHEVEVVAAVAVEYLPVEQAVQSRLLPVLLYLPAVHCVHGSGPAYPGLQKQEEAPADDPKFKGQFKQVNEDVAPTVVENFPAGQLVQAALPVAILYLPLAHAVQTPPLVPVYPRLQLQFKFDVHIVHEVLEFVGHSVHTPEPVSTLYQPAPH